MDLNGDGVLLGVAEVDSQVAQVLDQLPCFPPSQTVFLEFPRACLDSRTSGTLDSDDARLDVDLDYSHAQISVDSFPILQVPNMLRVPPYSFLPLALHRPPWTRKNQREKTGAISAGKKMPAHTTLWNFQELLRMNVLHPAGCELRCRGLRVS